MCTLTAISSTPGGSSDGLLFRVVVNRDEQRTRCPALPPIVRRFGDFDAILPIDPPSRGTWVGVNSAGLTLALLNSNPIVKPPARSGLRSRGAIIPSLLHCADASQAMASLLQINPREFPPFRLVAIDADKLATAVADGTRIAMQSSRSLDRPFLATSSGLGDHLVEWPRRDLFCQIMSSPLPPFEAQDAFHRHFWADRRHLSVDMFRSDALTVSRTVIEVRRDSVRMTYRSLPSGPAAYPAAARPLSDAQDSRALERVQRALLQNPVTA